MSEKVSRNIVKHGVEPRPVQDRNSGQGQVRVWLGNGEHRDYAIKDGVVNVGGGIKIPASLIGDFLYDAGLEVVGVEYFEDEEVQ